MNLEINDNRVGESSRYRRKWVVWIIIFVIFLFVFGYLSLIQTRAEILQATPGLAISKTHQGDFLIGSTGIYSITVFNADTIVISDTITVTDILTDVLTPVGVTGVGWDPCGYSGQMVTCIYSNTAGLPAGSSLPVIRLSVDVNPASTTQIINTASVTNTNDSDPSNNVASDPTNIVGADLAVSKTVTPASPLEGDVITYTLSLTNLGPSQATGIVLTDALPAGVTFQSSVASQGSYTNTTGLWNVGSLANGAVATLRLRSTVNIGTLGQTIVNSVEGLDSDVNDYDPTNNTASVSFTVQSTRVSGLVTDASTDNPLSGARVELQDSANRLYTMNTAANGWYTFTNTITTPIASGSATVRVSRSGYVSESATVAITTGQNTRRDFSLDTADLLVTKSDGLNTASPGQTITYTIAITNVGTIPAASVVITDVLTNLTYITDTLGITHSVPSALTYVWKLDEDIDPGDAVRFRLRVRVLEALSAPNAAIVNQVAATTESPEANLNNNLARDTNTASGSPNPSITISVSPNQIRINQNATYTIIVRNTGTAPMTDVVVEDTFSTLLDITSATTTKGTATRNNTTRLVTVSIGTLNRNEEVTIRVVTRANTNPSTNTTITNSARLSYKFGGSTTTRTSNSVSLQILVTTTLPGTGGVELGVQSDGSRSYLLAFISAGILIVLSLIAFGYALRTRDQQSEWSSWAVRMGIMLAVVSFLFVAAGSLLSEYSQPAAQSSLAMQDAQPGDVQEIERDVADSQPHNLVWPGVTPQIPGSELDALPDFPIPTPTISAPSDGNESEFDLTPVNRVIIPAIALDTIVKYVPFDGITWLIAGLKQEVAWMGDTSWPGLGSNTALAGHVTLRDGSNGPFRYLFDLRYGDAVFLYTEQNIYEYKVRDQLNVEETDMSVVGSTGDSQLTLITCSEWDADTGFYTKRYIVYADLVGVKSVNRQPQGN